MISTHIVTPKITYISFLDNCISHKTDEVMNCFNDAEILILFSVQQSSQINYPTECYFGNCKASFK